MAKIQPETGYTLIEILLVTAILCILSLITIPTFSSHEDEHKLTGAVTEIATALRYARSAALSTGNNHQIIIDQNTNEFTLVNSTNPASLVFHPASKKPYSLSLNDSSPYNGVDIIGTDTMSIIFYADGLTDTDVKISLNYGGNTAGLSVDAMTGNITIQ